MPDGVLVTVPAPVPERETLIKPDDGSNCAVAIMPPSVTVTSQVGSAAQPGTPLHPTKLDMAAGLAVSVTTLPTAKSAEHVDPQSIPAGELVTDPVPLPESATPNRAVAGANSADTDAPSAPRSTVQEGSEAQPATPLHPTKIDPADGVAVKVIPLPTAKTAEHVDPQSIPAGELVTEPDPLPVRATDNVAVGGSCAYVNRSADTFFDIPVAVTTRTATTPAL
jgi:hypothetical protein